MFKMSWKITIGAFQLGMLESIEVTRSVELLSDTAIITLPSAIFNQPFKINDLLHRGDAVKIEFGYDDKLVTEFEGYLETEPITDNGSLLMKCEDGLFLYRKSLKNLVMTNVSVKDVINHVNAELGGFTVNCDYDFKYSKFTINNATGYDVLKKIQEEIKANIYLKGTVLQVHPPYSEIFGKASYDFAVNIETADLKYKRVEDRKVLVSVEYTGLDGKVHKIEYGDTGGERVDRKGGTGDLASLLLQAKAEHANRVYDGYEGTFTGWLIPLCDAGYQVLIKDLDYEYKTGTYYVLEVKTMFSKEGGVRTIKIGKKLSDGKSTGNTGIAS